ncbi:uncharacterized protein BT62DRAFT_316680 [Guyanagaster necrorhizus]|uniref:Uncharacterized protein n=1 Tax=Guyanagaster necrorhizus TaxID=856835 RepID=A0A9P7VNF6_9AGAR|nr:uncharacterized protein BT62DRAFT_316680 [Guyanagaster necrorhizus MCA 3950]KAG7443550.1 hypothetical protein BT62DRAFT_316680 [Guyanagaster necrorhizus MCA 3950]
MRLAPVYSQDPSSSEFLLHHDSASSSCPGRWIYTTKHMEVDLGPRIWGPSHVPCYGLNGKIEGSIRFLGNLSSVTKVTLTLEVRLTTSEQRSSTLLSRTIPVYTPFTASPPQWNDICPFSLPVPTEINTNGGVSSMPPSFSCYSYNTMCDVSYFIKVCMFRKKNVFCTHESRRIPIMYLPKSEPYELSSSQKLPLTVQNTFLSYMTPQWIDSKNGHGPLRPPASFHDAIFFSLPSTIFVSGERIPFSVSLDTIKHPLLSQVLDKNIYVTLVNRVSLWSAAASSKPVYSERQIASGSVKSRHECQGRVLLRGFIQAGCAGKENSWCLEGIASVTYILRVYATMPKHLVGKVPTFHHETVITLTTDEWGTSQRELKTMGGIPTPALGLQIIHNDEPTTLANVFII